MLKVYFVDDDELIVQELRTIIDWKKYDFEICGFQTNPEIAKDEILSLCPSLVICDVQMDSINGLELANKISTINNKINFCFLSAYDKFDYAIEAIRIGALRYLKKPIKTSDLISLLNDIREKEVKDFSYNLSAILSSTNPYQNAELAKLFRNSILFKEGISFRIIVLFGDVRYIDTTTIFSSEIVLYSDYRMKIIFAYNVDIKLIEEFIFTNNISAGVSEEESTFERMGDLLKTARTASKIKFITNKHGMVIFSDNPNAEQLISKINKVNYPYELKKIIIELKEEIISLKIFPNYIQKIYQTIIYSMIKLNIIEYDSDVVNVSVLHFYQSLDHMINDLLVNFEECVEEDFNNSLIIEIKEDLKNNLSSKLSLSDYASKYGYNTSYFSQWFKKVCGITFVEYIITERIEKAKNLIMSKPHASLKSIAEEVGYDDYYHFSKIFKKYTGLSPNEFQVKCHN